MKSEYCAFNSEFDDMYAYGGEGLVFIKTIGYNGVNWPV
jgi:intraflagellar transport protein 122